MAAQRKAPAGSAARGEAVFQDGLQRDFTGRSARRLPAYARRFHLAPRQVAAIRIGWSIHRPPPPHELALPPGESPSGFDWSLLAGCHVFVCPPCGQIAPAGILRALGIELARAGVSSVILWDGERVVAEWWRCAAERPGLPGGAP